MSYYSYADEDAPTYDECKDELIQDIVKTKRKYAETTDAKAKQKIIEDLDEAIINIQQCFGFESDELEALKNINNIESRPENQIKDMSIIIKELYAKLPDSIKTSGDIQLVLDTMKTLAK